MSDKLARTKLYKGETRPPMRAGVPHDYLIMVLTLVTLNIILASSWAFLIGGFAVIGIAYVCLLVIVRRDYNAPRIWIYWLRTKGLSFDSARWGGASPSPFRVNDHRPRGIF
jgi:type IV secretion system protein VirB3